MLSRRRSSIVFALAAVTSLGLAACGNDDSGGTDTTTPAAGADTVCSTVDTSGTDLLAQVCKEGVITVSTDPAYPPQSSLNLETNELEGFDIDVATEIANRLGVDIAWEEPSWDVITSGGWHGRWDMSVGSMTVTKDRAKVLNFTPAYYYTPASIAVNKDNTTITDTSTDLDGKKIGVCSGCTYDYFLSKTLEIPGYTFDFTIDDADIIGYDTDSTAIQDLALGDGTRLDAAMSATPTLQGAIDKGKPIKIVGDPLFYEPLAVAFDKSSEADSQSITDAVGGIVDEMHADGTLTDMSMQWYKEDLTKAQG
ncbi:MAG TPA: transporter substrate-binding domain-containing protein [Actinomycetes bacterium]|nr:transporter substrate-binding domain-containing protein [Actinomycetes bacterium]